MTDLRQRVREEYDRFLSALPRLLESIPGKWVVFLNGDVQGAFDGENAALDSAVERFGMHGGFVVAPVVPIETIPVTAGVLYAAP